MCPSIIVNTQVNASNIISWDKKLKLDTWYVNNQSLCLDIKILLKTVKKVVIKDGISEEGEATMSKFMGNKKEYI